jgi:hypothetical protein
MLDIGVALFRKHVASEAARQGARNAIVHGYLAPNGSAMNAWGPTPSYYPALTTGSLYSGSASYTVRADDTSDDLANAVRPYLVGLDPSTVTVGIRWPDGDNAPGSRVSISIDFQYKHIIKTFFGGGTITVCASSTMAIVH